MATVNDYGQPTDRLSAPSLSLWAAAVAAAVNGNTSAINNTGLWQNYAGGVANGATFSGVTSRYAVIGKTVQWRFRGVVATVTGDTNFVPPIGLASSYASQAVGVATLVGAATYFATMFANTSGTSIFCRFPGVNGLSTALSATAPFTWAPGNQIGFQLTYESL